jgi:FkbM family methyltransferase
MPISLEYFNFGDIANPETGDPMFKYWLKKEFEEWGQYEKFFEVKKGDIVLDLGASIGPFLYSIKKKNPSKVIAVEPFTYYQSLLIENSEGLPVTIVQKALGGKDDEIINLKWSALEEEVETITFKSLIEQYDIEKIDFLKTDCEGGEYLVFNEENFDWIRKNTKQIVGEWHLGSYDLKAKFKQFRDLYLKNLEYIATSIEGNDISSNIWDDNFLENYTEIIIYIFIIKA